MKQKYKIALFITAFFLTANLLLLCHFGIYTLGLKSDYVAINTSGCIGVIYSDEQDIVINNPKSYSDEEGMSTIPRTITINNTCGAADSVSLYLDVYNDSTIYDSKMKVNVNGDLNLDTINLDKVNKFMGKDNVLNTYKLVNVKMEAFETKRLNLRMWLDYDEAVTKDKNKFHFKYYVISDKENNRLTFAETLVKNNTIKESDGLVRVDNSYYFNGSVSNNYVKLGETLWKIVGINEDHSVKLIYSSDVLESRFNDKVNDEKKVDFDNSIIKDYLTKYLENNLKDYDDIIVSQKYCLDTSYEGNYKKVYSSYTRNITNNAPSLGCDNITLEYGGIKEYRIGFGGTSAFNRRLYLQ